MVDWISVNRPWNCEWLTSVGRNSIIQWKGIMRFQFKLAAPSPHMIPDVWYAFDLKCLYVSSEGLLCMLYNWAIWKWYQPRPSLTRCFTMRHTTNLARSPRPPESLPMRLGVLSKRESSNYLFAGRNGKVSEACDSLFHLSIPIGTSKTMVLPS